MDLGHTLTRKIGPLPAVAWGGIALAGGGLIYYIIKKRAAAANATDTTATASDTGSDSDAYGVDSSSIGDSLDGTGVGAGGTTGGTTVSASNNAPTTNLEWQSMATSYLIGFGYPASAVNQALNNWLNGSQATSADTALFNLAVGQFGEPPEGVPQQPTNSTPTPPSLPGGTTAPPSSTVVTKPGISTNDGGTATMTSPRK